MLVTNTARRLDRYRSIRQVSNFRGRAGALRRTYGPSLVWLPAADFPETLAMVVGVVLPEIFDMIVGADFPDILDSMVAGVVLPEILDKVTATVVDLLEDVPIP